MALKNLNSIFMTSHECADMLHVHYPNVFLREMREDRGSQVNHNKIGQFLWDQQKMLIWAGSLRGQKWYASSRGETT